VQHAYVFVVSKDLSNVEFQTKAFDFVKICFGSIAGTEGADLSARFERTLPLLWCTATYPFPGLNIGGSSQPADSGASFRRSVAQYASNQLLFFIFKM
jgi:hypothetical protein